MKNKISERILASNNQFIVYNKPAGLPLQKAKNEMISVHEMLMAYCKHTLFTVHRLDQPVSGVVVFAKSQKTAAALSEQFKAGEISKSYFAVVGRREGLDSGELKHFLKKDSKENKSELVEKHEEGARECILEYQKIADIEHYSLLQITPKTGRHHQIRAQLAIADMPIKGDVKYGAKRSNKGRFIHLHARKISFKHPVTGKLVEFEAPFPTLDPVWAAFSEIMDWT